jgi:hypothetical protein
MSFAPQDQPEARSMGDYLMAVGILLGLWAVAVLAGVLAFLASH